MIKYGKNVKEFNPLLHHKLNIDRQSLGYVKPHSKVLDIGCATGFMGKYLQNKKKCEVVGVDIRKDEIRVARTILKHTFVLDMEDVNAVKKLKREGVFDVILASAVIEHLKNPMVALTNWRKLLKPSGILIVTTPNIAHWSIRMQLLKGKFNYEEYGILDNTHLHFFTIRTFKDTIINAGYSIEKFAIDPVGGGYPKASMIASKLFPSIFAYQMLIVAKNEKG